MQFMIIRKADADTEAGKMPSEALIKAMTDYNTKMVDAGIMRFGEGLKPSAKGARVSFSGGKPRVIDGPFSETKELVAGISVIEVASLDEALEWVKQWPVKDGDGNVQLEVRPVVDIADFGEAFTEGLQQQEAELRRQVAERQRG